MSRLKYLFVCLFQNLKEKQNSVDCFADYAKNFNMYKKNTSSYQQKVEYIKSLYEVSGQARLVSLYMKLLHSFNLSFVFGGYFMHNTPPQFLFH